MTSTQHQLLLAALDALIHDITWASEKEKMELIKIREEIHK